MDRYSVVHGSWDRQDNAVYNQDGKIVISAHELYRMGLSTVDLINRYPCPGELDIWVYSVLTKGDQNA